MQKDNQKIHLVYAADAKYLTVLSLPIASAYYWASDPSRLVVHIITTAVKSDNWMSWYRELKRHLPPASQIVQEEIPSDFFSRFHEFHGSKAVYNRLLAPELLKDVDWCAYADGDTLFLDDPLKLISIFDSTFAIQAHKDILEIPGYKPEIEAWYLKNNLPFDKGRYFCSGFVLMNLEMFRQEGLSQRCIDFLDTYPDNLYVDQDALNVICFDKAKLLPPEWGIFAFEAFTVKRPSLIHYPGWHPWTAFPGSVGYNDVIRVWFDYAKLLLGKSWREMTVTKWGGGGLIGRNAA